MHEDLKRAVAKALDTLAIEVPSWGFANTGTRFGKFVQPGAANTIDEKLADAAEVHRFTGCCPRVAVHVAWDFPDGAETAASVAAAARDLGVSIGSINPTLFEDQAYKYGSLGNPDPAVRSMALDHIKESISCMRAAGSSELVLWFADGSNYPGSAHIRNRKRWFETALADVGADLRETETMLVEYKPFEPAFYHTDVADWGMAYLLARTAGPRARVLVDTGHHYQGQNIEQIVAWLLSEGMLGGFHFNDRRYADDDLTVGSIDPYQLFRVFYEIHQQGRESGSGFPISYMIDQSHNLKTKIEATIQTVMAVQELYAKAALIDFEALETFQAESRVLDAEECLQDAFKTDVRPAIQAWRSERGLPANPLAAYRESGYQQRIDRERADRNRAGGGYV